jgi:DNA-directed RNA polymerase specialized sigma24 family protein
MRNMDPEVRRHIEEANWEKLTKKLLYYVGTRLGLIYGRSHDIALPGGQSAEDIVQETVSRFLEGKRKWKPSRVALFDFLKGIASSLISHHHELKETKLRDTRVLVDTNAPEDDIPGTRRQEAVDPTGTPEEALIPFDTLNTAFNRLCENAGEEEDYNLVLMCIEDGITKPTEIASETGLDILQVYTVKRRVLNDLDKILYEIMAT